jgi:polyhydroxyalkanoate synthase
MANRLVDLRANRGMPSTVKAGALRVGADLAVTPGAVVTRDPVAELIQYQPTTELVRERPTLIVPPPIGRYYFLDLAPGRSFVEHSVSRGLQTFMLSWHNPTRAESDRDLDAYAARVLSAISEVKEITGQDSVNVIGFCAGGLLTAIACNRLAADGDTSVNAASFAVTLIDFGGGNPIDVFGSGAVRALAGWGSRRRGVIDAKTMGSAFTWMRPNDLVWNYWVNNYLLGEDPPVFDILAWNADGTSLPARLHQQFLDIFGENLLGEVGRCTFLDAPFDLGVVKIPNFVVGAVNDHLTPWRGTYRTTELLGGDSTYVLSNAGHIASLVNPPGNPKASYYTGPGAGEVDADTWKGGATQVQGSWWSAWADWSADRSGAEVSSSKSVGSASHPALMPAPGAYVRDERAS